MPYIWGGTVQMLCRISLVFNTIIGYDGGINSASDGHGASEYLQVPMMKFYEDCRAST